MFHIRLWDMLLLTLVRTPVCICTVSIHVLLCAESPTIANYADRTIDSLRKEVQDVFNGLYSEFINIATVTFRRASLCISTLLNMLLFIV